MMALTPASLITSQSEEPGADHALPLVHLPSSRPGHSVHATGPPGPLLPGKSIKVFSSTSPKTPSPFLFSTGEQAEFQQHFSIIFQGCFLASLQRFLGLCVAMLLAWTGVNASHTGEKGRLEKGGRTYNVVAARLVLALDTPGGEHPKPLRWSEECPEHSTADYCSPSSIQKMWPRGDYYPPKEPSVFFGDVSNSPQKGQLL